MPNRRSILSRAERDTLFAIPADPIEISRVYAFDANDLALIRTRRTPGNQLGLALHLGLLRAPGFGWRDTEQIPGALITWIADLIGVDPADLAAYTPRPASRSDHRAITMGHLGLRPFIRSDYSPAKAAAAQAAFGTDSGRRIMSALLEWCRNARLVLPSTDTLERIAVAGRAQARREAAERLIGQLVPRHIDALDDLLVMNPDLGSTRLAWLRDIPASPSPDNLLAILDRRRFVQEIALPDNLGDGIYPDRMAKFAREGGVAPAYHLSDYGPRRRRATLAAQVRDLEITLSDAAIEMFEKLIGAVFTRSRRSKEQKFQASANQVGKLMRLFDHTIGAIQTAVDEDRDPFDVIQDTVGWWTLLKVRGQVSALGELADEDPLIAASRRYTYLRRFVPAFLDAFDFRSASAGKSLLRAVDLLRDHNSTGKRKLPDERPMPFPARHWRRLIEEVEGAPGRHRYETAVVSTLRDRLRAGDVWVQGTRSYRRFDAYLLSSDAARNIIADTGLEMDARLWLEGRRANLDARLTRLERHLKGDRLEGVRLHAGRLSITPLEPETPPEATALDRRIDAMMPVIRITDLLWQVATETGFLDAFRDLRTGRAPENPGAVLAAILAGATNLGLERMARASSGVTYAQINWASTWYLRPETYAAALTRIIDTHHAHPFTRVWDDIGTSSSDGQFFPSGRRSGEINAKYGPDPGLKIYSFLSGQYGSFASNVIGATAGEAPHVLDGLIGHAAAFTPAEHYTDTGGVSDHVFALFMLLGLCFVPRIRDFPDRKLACFRRPGNRPGLAPLLGKPINEDVITENWEDILRLTASIKTGAICPSDMLRKLGAYRQQNRLHLALGEVGRIERTLFMIDWLEDPKLRRRCQGGLNKGESRHALADAVFAHSQGRIHDRRPEAQQNRAAALNLVIAAIIFWNTKQIAGAVDQLRSAGVSIDAHLLRHVSPLGWAHIILTGDYFWDRQPEMTTSLGDVVIKTRAKR